MKNILAITALSFALILTGCGEPTLSAEGEAAVNYLTNYNYLKDNCEIDSMEDLGMAMGVVMVSPVLLAELGQDKEGNEEFLAKRQALITGSCGDVRQAIKDAGKAFKAVSK